MSTRKFALFATVVAFAFAIPPGAVAAHDFKLGDLHIGHPYTRVTPPGAKVAGAYLSIDNKGKAADRLLKATSPAAASVALHSMSMDGNIMRMRAVPAIAVAPGASVKLAPGGLHIMLEDLRQPLKKGDKFPLTLYFEKAGQVRVEILVQDHATPAAKAGDNDHEHRGHVMK